MSALPGKKTSVASLKGKEREDAASQMPDHSLYAASQ